jgi:hypothetical protein
MDADPANRTMNDSPIDLQREFGEPVDHEGLDDRWERALMRLASKRKTRGQLNAHTTVVLGEGGTGKTTELRARVAELNAAGAYAFFIPIVDIVGRELRRAIGVEVDRLDSWLRSDHEAWFFLDGLDEGKLAGASLRGLLHDLESQLATGLRRTRVVMSCRPSEWEAAADLAVLRESASRWNPDAALPVEVLVMLPLDLDRSMRLARHLGVQDMDAFSAAIDAAGLELFLERPLDVVWFVSMWNEKRKLGSLTQMLQENIRVKLTDRPRAAVARRIPADQARTGVRRLAAVATLSGQRAFPVNAGAQRAAGGFRVADILHDWSGEDVDGLLSLPMFDEAVGGMVRLHSREVQEFLCAEWISEQIRSGALSVEQLSSLFFIRQGQLRTIPPHLVRVAAWLAPQQPRIFDLLVECAPHQLLDEGDPAALPLPNRERALRAFAKRYRDRNRIDIWFEERGLRRFADQRLSPTISTLLTDAFSEDVRVLLLKLIGFGQLGDLADVALRIALDQNDSTHVRYAAIEAAALAGTPNHRVALRKILDQGTELDLEIAAQLIEHLFPSILTLQDLRRMILAVAPRGRRSTHTRLDSVLWTQLPRLCPPHAQQEIIGILLDAHATASGDWLVHPIAKMVATTIDARPDQLAHIQTRRALTLLSDHGSGNDAKPILDVARGNERVRQGLIWWQIEQLRATEDRFVAWRLRSSALIGQVLSVDDFRWLEQDAVVQRDEEVATAARQIREAMETPYVPPAPVVEPAFDAVTRGRIEEHLDEIRGGHAGLLDFCIDPFDKSGNGWGTIDVAAMTRELPSNVVEAIRTGLSRFWRAVDIMAPRDWPNQGTPTAAVLGLRALGWELVDSTAVGTLSADEAVRATKFALWELNEFPEWLQPLRGYHTGAVDEEIAAQAIHELRSGDTRERVLMKVLGAAEPLRRAITERIEQLLLDEVVPWSIAFQSAVSLLSWTEANDVGRWRAVLYERFSTVVNDEQFASYWMLELRADRATAISRLECLLARKEEVVRVDAVIEQLWKWIDDEAGPFPCSNDPVFLERLYVVLLNPGLPASDSVLAGRGRLRSVIEHWLSKVQGGTAIFTRLAARDDAPFRESRDHFLRLADQSLRAMPSMTPMSRTDAVNWTKAREITVTNEVSLFEIVHARLESIATFLAHDRHSYRTLFHRGDGPVPERDFQLWLASELANRSAGQYNVIREEEDAERKRPDLTLHVTGLLPLSIEIKVADSWSYNDLRAALSDQLVERYMHEVRSCVGMLVVCITHKMFWEKADGSRVYLDQLLADLRQLANELVDAGAGSIQRLAVVLLDFRTLATVYQHMMAARLPVIVRPLFGNAEIEAGRTIVSADATAIHVPPRGLTGVTLRSYGDLYLQRPRGPRGQPRTDGAVEAANSPTIHLNVWFPDFQEAEVTLTVGVATAMWINLANSPRAGTLASERVSDDAVKHFYEVDYVDVIAVCPGADVEPLRARLPLPPNADTVARFELTPRRSGNLNLSVILLIEGEAIHQTTASIFASAQSSATTEVPP